MKEFIFLILNLFIIFIFSSTKLYAQNHWFDMPSFWEVGSVYIGPLVYNIESFDINRDGHLDVISGNWNDTYVYYGGYGILDTAKDLIYTGRMLAICDYNGDGFKDMITMHFTAFDSSRLDYNGELLFYWGSDTTAIAIDTIADFTVSLPTLYPTFEDFTLGYFTVGIQKGDFNGDGKTDLVFSSTGSVDSLGNIGTRGKIYIYMGKVIPSDTADFVLIGENIFAFIGDFVQVGDINGDGFDDFLYSSDLLRMHYVHYDSINYLHIYLGSEDFQVLQGNESEIYQSRVNPPDSIAGWFIRKFSVNDINGDGIDDIVIGRSFYNYPHQTTVHYGSISGIDTIPSFTFIQDTTMVLGFFSAGSVMQDVGDYNMDGYDDFIMSPAGYKLFALHFGGPHVSNNNRYGARGYSNGGDVFPRKSINMGDQTNDGVNDIAVVGGYHILMLYGQDIPTVARYDKFQPLGFNLYQNYPNPFNSTTIINYQLTTISLVTLKIYDILGKEITTLVNEEQNAGEHKIYFDASKFKLSSGVYLYKLKVKGGEMTKKMTYLK